MSSPSPSTNVGIDVSKETLDIAAHETETHWICKHEYTEFPQLLKSLKALTPTRIIIEASGGTENLLVSYLATAGLPVIVVNPPQVRDFARATGQFAKTDRIDAFILARFGATLEPAVRQLKSAEMQDLEALVARRAQLVNMLTAERLRLQQALQQRRQSTCRQRICRPLLTTAHSLTFLSRQTVPAMLAVRVALRSGKACFISTTTSPNASWRATTNAPTSKPRFT
jgi:transposase